MSLCCLCHRVQIQLIQCCFLYRFGSKVFSPSTGIILNNQLYDFCRRAESISTGKGSARSILHLIFMKLKQSRESIGQKRWHSEDSFNGFLLMAQRVYFLVVTVIFPFSSGINETLPHCQTNLVRPVLNWSNGRLRSLIQKTLQNVILPYVKINKIN